RARLVLVTIIKGASDTCSHAPSPFSPKGPTTMRTKLFFGLGFTALLLFTGSGCKGGIKPVKIEGSLKWENGSPVAGADVKFLPVQEDGKVAYGTTGNDGKFELTTENFGDGAMPGKYKVIVTKSSSETTGEGGDLEKGSGNHPRPPGDFAKMMEK